MKEIYDLLKGLAELEPKRFQVVRSTIQNNAYVRLEHRTWYVIREKFAGGNEGVESAPWCGDAVAFALIEAALREAIEAHGRKWHIGNDHGIENRPEYVAVITINEGLYATEFGEIAIIALLRAYITALRAAERYKR